MIMSDIQALETERRGYVMRGLDDRVAQVDAQIAAITGVEALQIEAAVDVTPIETSVTAKPSIKRRNTKPKE